MNHIESSGLLPEGQHGSRPERSTLTQLLAYWDTIIENLQTIDGGDAIYLNFGKELDKVETNVLIHKLKKDKI